MQHFVRSLLAPQLGSSLASVGSMAFGINAVLKLLDRGHKNTFAIKLSDRTVVLALYYVALALLTDKVLVLPG